jgi:hypothetical protein
MMNPIQTLEPRYLYAPIPKMEGMRFKHQCHFCKQLKSDDYLVDFDLTGHGERIVQVCGADQDCDLSGIEYRKRFCQHENRERFHGNHYSQRIEICNDCEAEFTVEIEDAEAIWELNA